MTGLGSAQNTLVLEYYTNNVGKGRIDSLQHDQEQFKFYSNTTVEELVEEACEKLQFSVQMAAHFGIVSDLDKGQPLPPDTYIEELVVKTNTKLKLKKEKTATRYWLRLIYIPHFDHIWQQVDDVTARSELLTLDDRVFNYLYRQIHWDLMCGDLAERYEKVKGLSLALGLCTIDMSIQAREADVSVNDLQPGDCVSFIPRTLSFIKKKDTFPIDNILGCILPSRIMQLAHSFLAQVREQTRKWSAKPPERQKVFFISSLLKAVPQYGEIRYECLRSVDIEDSLSPDVAETPAKAGMLTVLPPTHKKFGLVWVKDKELSKNKDKDANDEREEVHLSAITLIAVQEIFKQAVFKRSDNAPPFTIRFTGDSKRPLHSLLTVLNMYHRLSMGWSESLCDTYGSARLRSLANSSIHPPASFKWVSQTLERSVNLGNPYSCVVTQHPSKFSHYILYTVRTIERKEPAVARRPSPTSQYNDTSSDFLHYGVFMEGSDVPTTSTESQSFSADTRTHDNHGNRSTDMELDSLNTSDYQSSKKSRYLEGARLRISGDNGSGISSASRATELTHESNGEEVDLTKHPAVTPPAEELPGRWREMFNGGGDSSRQTAGTSNSARQTSVEMSTLSTSVPHHSDSESTDFSARAGEYGSMVAEGPGSLDGTTDILNDDNQIEANNLQQTTRTLGEDQDNLMHELDETSDERSSEDCCLESLEQLIQKNHKIWPSVYYIFPTTPTTKDGKQGVGRLWSLYCVEKDSNKEPREMYGVPTVCSIKHASPRSLLRHLHEKHGFTKPIDYSSATVENSGLMLAAPRSVQLTSVPEEKGFFSLHAPREATFTSYEESNFTRLSTVKLSIPLVLSIPDRLVKDINESLPEIEEDQDENLEKPQLLRWVKREVLRKSANREMRLAEKAKKCLRDVVDDCSNWRHDALVTIYHLVGDDSVIMEKLETKPKNLYGDSKPLKSIRWMIKHSLLSVKHKLQVLFQVARALSYITEQAHVDRTVHGNITTSNIFVTHFLKESIRIKLGDPGLAAFYLTLEQSNDVVVKRFHYYPPEFRLDWSDAKLSTEADIYAFGVLAIELFYSELDRRDLSRLIDDGLPVRADSAVGQDGLIRQRLREELMLPCVRNRPEDRLKIRSILSTISLISLELNATLWAPMPPLYYSYPCYESGVEDKALDPAEKFENTELHPDSVVLDRDHRGKPIKLGEGYFGFVYQGTYSGRDVAVKELNKVRRNLDEEALKMELLEEMKKLSEAKSPNIVEIMGYYTLNENLFLVMERMESSTLHFFQDTLKNRLLKVKESSERMRFIQPYVVNICHDVADALSFLHSKRMLHLDLAPRNVLFQSKGPCKIGDFGISQKVNDQGYVRLSQKEAAWRIYPLEAYEAKEFRFSTDIWSFGLLMRDFLFECRAPAGHKKGMKSSDFFEQLRRSINNRSRTRSFPFDCPENVDIEIERIMLSCLRTPLPQASRSYESVGPMPGIPEIKQLLLQEGPRPSAAELLRLFNALKCRDVYKVVRTS